MKKILLTSLSGQLGGLELRLQQEACFLKKIGFQAELGINPFPEIYPWIKTLQKEEIPFHFFDPYPFYEQWQWRRLNKIRAALFSTGFLKREKYDLVHVAMAWTDTGGTRLWLAQKCGLPSVISVHNAFRDESFHVWHDDLLAYGFQSVKGVYAVSDSALESFLKLFSKFLKKKTRVEVIYNPVDTSTFLPSPIARQQARKRFGIEENAVVIGVVGRLDGQKQPLLLIDVFEALKKQFKQLQLVFIGQGHLESKCREKVTKLGLNLDVHFLGFQKNIAGILPILDIHVLLSTLEGFGIATAEAMACGVPVVATNVAGSRDILRDSEAGMLVPKGDFNHICKVLTDLIENSDKRISLGNEGPKEVEKRFSQQVIEEKLGVFYQDIFDQLKI